MSKLHAYVGYVLFSANTVLFNGIFFFLRREVIFFLGGNESYIFTRASLKSLSYVFIIHIICLQRLKKKKTVLYTHESCIKVYSKSTVNLNFRLFTTYLCIYNNISTTYTGY